MAESSGETVPSVGEDTSDIEAICLDINIIYTYGSTANIGQPVSAASQKLIDYLNRIVDGDIGTLVLRLAELSLEKQAKWLNVLARAQVEPCLLCNSKNLSEVVKYSLSSNNKEISANILDLCARGYNHNNASVIVKYASESLPSDHLALSEKAWEILENYIMNNKRSDLIVELFQSGQRYIKDSVKYMRYAALLVKVSAATSELFNECADVGAIDAVINMCKNDDVLTQMNCLDMLGSIGTTADGLQFLQTRGIFDWLIEVSCGPMHPSGEIEGPQGMDTLISAQCLRVLGNLFLNSSSNHYQMLQVIDPMKIKHLLSAVSQIYMDDRDEANKLTGLGFIVDFAVVSVQSFRLVMDNSIVLDTWLRMMNAHKAELHGAVLHSIAKVLDSSDEQMINFSYESAEEGKSSLEQRPLNNTKEVVDMKKRLFHNIGKFKTATALSHLIKLARQPVDELKHGALDILRSLATQPSGWGVAELFYVNIAMNDTVFSTGDLITHATPNFAFESFIKDRTTEYSKEGKDWKFSLIQAIANSPSRSMLREEVNKSIDKLIQQGPYFMPAKLEEMETI